MHTTTCNGLQPDWKKPCLWVVFSSPCGSSRHLRNNVLCAKGTNTKPRKQSITTICYKCFRKIYTNATIFATSRLSLKIITVLLRLRTHRTCSGHNQAGSSKTLKGNWQAFEQLDSRTADLLVKALQDPVHLASCVPQDIPMPLSVLRKFDKAKRYNCLVSQRAQDMQNMVRCIGRWFLRCRCCCMCLRLMLRV